MAAKTAKSAAVDEKKAPRLSDVEEEMLAPKKPEADKKEKKKAGKKSDAEEFPRSGGNLRVVLIASLVWLALLSAAVIAVLYDPTGGLIRGPVLLFLNPEEETREEYYASEIESNLLWERDLSTWEKELSVREQELDIREEDIDNRESAVEDREYEAETLLEALRETSGSGEVAPDINKMAKNLGLMTAANAANSLENMDFDIAVRLCSLIQDKKLAPILDAMNSEMRAMVIETLSTPQDDIELP